MQHSRALQPSPPPPLPLVVLWLASSPIRTSRPTVSGVTNSKSGGAAEDGEEEEEATSEQTNGKRRDRPSELLLPGRVRPSPVNPAPLQVPKSRLRTTVSSLSNLTGWIWHRWRARRGNSSECEGQEGKEKRGEERRRGEGEGPQKSNAAPKTVLFSRITERRRHHRSREARE